ncbi:putative heme utilization radical SAM enzyme HutW [Vibrio sp. UCD-FRSSP16_10]|uniref:heme anaerobic degradation radical SAM methyltransferase ChuW/HutW n=1 Tax=unclassified Vibrio TaxID=2614977 RepID=UPI000801A7C3|nr:MULTISPECIES: heme anaerobic degradation radical SAM methyltransferase ChuW/HutW [unclassified Vibrio]OBT15508.1 putative heme utilization radical SAM enzyme HutW [Vibrio sp. UCD-FRSSP16_30]OBT20581.1 putative heme utilization radical SAM enzyme HutW [Vibrio sp. UCD-FRSSP16_10]
MNLELNNLDITGKHTPDPLRFSFAKKKGPHAGGMAKPVPANLVQATLSHAMSETGEKGARCLYIHIPFCRVRCTYCNFFQYASSTKLIDQYFEALKKELIWKASMPWSQAFPFQAVYIGGGTPTDLSAEQIKQLAQMIRRYFPLTPDCEMTLEGRINRFDDHKFESALEGGINRFSFGVQSFDTKVRRSAKRLNDGDEVLERLQHFVSYDSAPIVIDLLYGLPHQTLSNWAKDLDIYLESGAHGVDLYQLIEMQNLPMGRLVEQGKLPEPANTQMKATMYQMGVEFMAKNHQRRLSVNHWSSDNRERSIYNSLAKTSAQVMPLGAGAGGNVNGISTMQYRDMDQYIEAGQSSLFASAMAFSSAPNAHLVNTIKAAFDRGVLSNQSLPNGLFERLNPLFEAWNKNGLAELNHGYLSLTLAGQFWSVTLAQNLIQVISNNQLNPHNNKTTETA